MVIIRGLFLHSSSAKYSEVSVFVANGTKLEKEGLEKPYLSDSFHQNHLSGLKLLQPTFLKIKCQPNIGMKRELWSGY